MKSLHLIFILSLSLVCASIAASFDISSIRTPQYRVDDYIRAAMSLQALGREDACQILLASAKTNAMLDPRYFALCRMLFMQRGTNEFRPPFPNTMYFGSFGKAADWHLAPIELVDGIPFFLGSGGRGGGGRAPESAESYLLYCMSNCDWNTFRFSEVTAEQKSAALAKFLSLEKMNHPVTDFVRQHYQAQTE